MGEAPKREWMESVQLVFDYFCERTPRSFVEARDTSVVWNYKYAGEPGYFKTPDKLHIRGHPRQLLRAQIKHITADAVGHVLTL